MAEIRYVQMKDKQFWYELDKHLSVQEFAHKVRDKQGYVLIENKQRIGLLRYNLFWDNIPFMNMLYFLEDYREKGYGSQLASFWEQEMKKSKYNIVLTSTKSNEQAQFFYRRIGYVDCGSLLLPNEPLEIILLKNIV